jgi:hypothetical protein
LDLTVIHGSAAPISASENCEKLANCGLNLELLEELFESCDTFTKKTYVSSTKCPVFKVICYIPGYENVQTKKNVFSSIFCDVTINNRFVFLVINFKLFSPLATLLFFYVLFTFYIYDVLI